jgi:hypothetical protein
MKKLKNIFLNNSNKKKFYMEFKASYNENNEITELIKIS